MKIRLLIASPGLDYTEYLSKVLVEKYADVFEVSVCSNEVRLSEMVSGSRADIVLAEADLASLVGLHSVRLPLIFSDERNRGGMSGEDCKSIKKYQRISCLVKEIIGAYAEVSSNSEVYGSLSAQITAFWSPVGGNGKTASALAYATNCVAQWKKTVYLDLQNFSCSSVYFQQNDNPIRNWANELHAKESSKKVRAVKKLQAERGERLGGRPPYGYRKRDSDTKEIVPDEDTAPVVQRIFELCASGKGPNQIARILTADKVLNPTNYYYQKYGTSHRHLDTTSPYHWSGSTVTGILDNKVYLGHMPGLRNTSISYKNKKRIIRPESEQVLVENTHEPLVTQERWDIVQTVRQHKKRVPKQMDEPNLFSGLVYCADCGKPLILHRASTMKKTAYNFQCYTFGKRGKGNCSPHHIREMDLTKIVLDDIRRVTHSARTQERQFAQYINQKNSVELRREMNALQKELDAMQKRNGELSMLFKRLYEDHVLGRVTAEQFRMLSGDYNAEQKALEEAIPGKESRLEKLKASAANVDTFIEKAKQYTAINELTPELLRLFIQRIEVGERSKKYSRSAAQSVRIIYRDIGSMDRPMEAKVLQPHDAPRGSPPDDGAGVNAI